MKSICNAGDEVNRCAENNKKAGWDRFSDNQDNTDLKSIKNVADNNRNKNE